MLGKAMNKVPPKLISQTSCQLHDGPRPRRLRRRSSGLVLSAKCTTPQPMFQPSRIR